MSADRINSKQFAAEIDCSWTHAKALIARAVKAGETWVAKVGGKYQIDLAAFKAQRDAGGSKARMKQKNSRRRSGTKKKKSTRVATAGAGKARREVVVTPKHVVGTPQRGDGETFGETPKPKPAAPLAVESTTVHEAKGAAAAAWQAIDDSDAIESIEAHIRHARRALFKLGANMEESPDEFASAFKDISTELRQLEAHLREEKAKRATTIEVSMHEAMLESVAKVTQMYLKQMVKALPTKLIGDIVEAGVTIDNALLKKVTVVVQQRCETEYESVLAMMADKIEEARMQEVAA